ncbi:DUF2975 domain-containing protein [Qipengyuania sp. GPGPB31]|uniref:DUF2975 domain-containing protein n=1 Tax=Qipengyuania sp. GPGPB31 TaxID=3023518 RepID=UPI00313461E3
MYVFILAGLRFFRWVNWIVAALLTLFFVVLLTDAGGLGTSVLAGVEGDLAVRAQVRDYLLGVTGLVLPMALAIDRILTRLAGLVHDARAGTALSEANAARLRTIGWCLLAINLADLVYGSLSVRASAATGEYFGWSLSLTGWVAVPLLFVLAHVFREGAAMRDDLEGTV